MLSSKCAVSGEQREVASDQTEMVYDDDRKSATI